MNVSGRAPAGSSQADQAARPLVSLADARAAGRILAIGLIAWCVPESRWPAVSAAAARRVPPTAERVAAIDRLIDGQGFGADATSIYRDALAAKIESHLQLLRACRPGGWRPATRVDGRERLEEALARGRGAVLWLPVSTAYSLGAKIALDATGFEVSHVSHPRHGFSSTRLGTRVLNPIRTRVEDRYLQSRIMLTWQGSMDALRESLRRLRSNEIVSITAGPDARDPVTVPFLGGDLQIAGGAPALAHSADAMLLPTFPLTEEDGTVRVSIEPPLSRAAGENKREFVTRCALTFARLLESEVRRCPAQWLGWSYVEPTGRSQAARDRPGDQSRGTAA